MSISVDVDNGGEKYLKAVAEKSKGWIQFATGEDAIAFRDFVTPWVYSSVGFKEQSGKLGRSIYAGLKKRNGNFTTEWVIGPKPTHFNWIAKWIPTARKYAGFDHDFLHKAWDAYNGSNNIKENIEKILQGKLDGLKQQNL